MVGLLGVTALSIAQATFTHWAYAAIGLLALLLALRTKIHPFAILVGGATLGAILG